MKHRPARWATRSWLWPIVLVLVQVAVTASPAYAATWAESGDAPSLPPGQEPTGTGPLTSISGAISGNGLPFGTDIDMYKICLDGNRTFSATTVGLTTVDTYLALFDVSGRGVYANMNASPTVEQSTLPAGAATLSPSAPGVYYLGVSTSDLAPLDASGAHIFTGSGVAVQAPAGTNPMAGWVIGRLAGGPYTVNLTGARVCPVVPDAPATLTCTRTLSGVVPGRLDVIAGTTCLQGASASGPITVFPGAALSVKNSLVSGSVVTVQASAVTICSSLFTGDVRVNASTGFVLIGDGGDGPPTPCVGSSFARTVVLDANTGGLEFGGNFLFQDLLVIDNVAPGGGVPIENNATEIEVNVITGVLLCDGNIPAPTNDDRPNVVGFRVGQCGPSF